MWKVSKNVTQMILINKFSGTVFLNYVNPPSYISALSFRWLIEKQEWLSGDLVWPHLCPKCNHLIVWWLNENLRQHSVALEFDFNLLGPFGRSNSMSMMGERENLFTIFVLFFVFLWGNLHYLLASWSCLSFGPIREFVGFIDWRTGGLFVDNYYRESLFKDLP